MSMCHIVANHMAWLFYQIKMEEHSGSVGKVLNLEWKGQEFETHCRHCVVFMSKTLYPLLSTDSSHPDMTGKLLTGCKHHPNIRELRVEQIANKF